jgi:hypothetical protein
MLTVAALASSGIASAYASSGAPVWTDQSIAPAAQVGVWYSDAVSADGDATILYSVTAGALPDGLTLDPGTGAISGYPGTADDFDFSITATNDSGSGDPIELRISVAEAPDAPPTWTDDSIDTDMYVGYPYEDGVAADGHPAPTYSIDAGSLPHGVTLDPITGGITGTPDAQGPYDVTIRAGNGVGSDVTLEFSGTAYIVYAPTWTDDTIVSSMQVGVAYSDGVSADGFPAPMYLTSSGSLPEGVGLDQSTGAITGVPQAAGPYDVTIMAMNGLDPRAEHEFRGTVLPPETRGCVNYSARSYLGSIVLNPDGTPIGCGTTADAGAPADLTPADWATTWDDRFGSMALFPYSQRLGWACDDCSIGIDGEDGVTGLPIGFPINFYGTTYDRVFVNSNGSISFGSGSDFYDQPLDQILNGAAGVVAFGVDLDNRAVVLSGSQWGADRHVDFFYWGRTTYQGHEAFVATWMNMNGFRSAVDKTDFDSFQILLVDVDGAAGTNVDIVVNYGSLQTDYKGYGHGSPQLAIGIGTVQSGVTTYASMVDDDGTLYNGMPVGDTVDGGSHALSSAHLNSTVPGRFAFQMRDGQLPQTATVPGAPKIVDAARGDAVGTVSWTDPANTGGSPLSGYTLRYRIAGSSASWTTRQADASPYEIAGVANGTSYEVQVAVANGIGTSEYSAPAYFTPGAGGSLDWTDQSLGVMYAGRVYADGVSAAGDPTPTYAVTDGSLPDGLHLDGITGAITGSPTTAGPYDFTIDASSGAATLSRRFTGAVFAAPADQTITFTAPEDHLLANSPFTVSATATSGLAVALASNSSSVCTVLGTWVTLRSTGTCSITARQAGNVSYAPAPSVTRTFRVSSPDLSPPTGGEPPAPSPSPNSGMTLDRDSALVSSALTVSGWGFMPGSGVYVVLHSTPVVLGQGQADGAGHFSEVVHIPTGTELGAHTVELVGHDPNDQVLVLSKAITVGGASGTPPVTSTGPGQSEPGSPGSISAIIAILMGLLLAVATASVSVRRRALR